MSDLFIHKTIFVFSGFFCALLFSLSQPGTRYYYHEQASIETIPFEIVSNRLIIEVHVNGKGPFKFGIDLGATGVGRVDDDLVKKLGLSVSGTTQNWDGVTSKTANLIGVDNISFGSVEWSDQNLMTRNYSPKDGLVGRGFFSNKLLTIDYLNQKIILSDGELRAEMKGVISYQQPFIVEGKLGEADATFYIDTGSSMTFLMPKNILDDSGAKYEDTGKKFEAKRANTIHDIVEAKLIDPIEIGGIKLKEQIFYYSDFGSQINFGSEALRNFIITFDQKNKLILIEK